MEAIQPEQILVLPDGFEFNALALEWVLLTLRRHGRVEIRGKDIAVPSACELAISTLSGAGASVNVTGPQLERMNRQIQEALV